MDCLLKGFIIGLVFGVPIGAVGTITFRRSLAYGARYGIVTGAGSSVADCIYAVVGAFGLTFISDFLLRFRTEISFVGGALIIGMGVSSILEKPVKSGVENKPAIHTAFLSAFAVGITNPAAILTFLFAFSLFEIPSLTAFSGTMLVAGVLVGTMLWWVIISVLAAILKKRLKKPESLNKFFGVLLTAFGISVFIKALFN